jgi:NDP-sugar pyrophosphorylase family protein
MQCLILAGGLGSRMRPYTAAVPKALLIVAGRPFADWQLDWLASQGVSRVVYSVGYLGSAIQDHIGDGERWSMTITYVHECDGLRGTAGAVRLAVDADVLGETFIVLYGDSYLRVSLRAVESAFRASGLPALMTVFKNNGELDRSNVVFQSGRVLLYDKFCTTLPTGMDYIDYGLTIMRREVIEEMIPPDVTADLAPLFTTLSERRLLAGFEATERFFEVGSPQGLRSLEAFLAERQRRTNSS